MISIALLGALWAVVGIPLVVRHLQERRDVPMTQFQRAMGALQTTDDTGRTFDLQARRRLVSVLLYCPGLVLGLLGLAVGDGPVIAVAVAFVNLGTAHRLQGLRVDRAHRRAVQHAARRSAQPFVLPPARLELPFEPSVDEGPGDAQTRGDGWQIIRPEPLGVDDLVLVDADVS